MHCSIKALRRSDRSRGIVAVGKRVMPQVGDVLEVTLRDGRLAYLQMVSESEIGEVARVLPGRYGSAPGEIGALAAGPRQYLVFAMLRELVRDGYARRLGTWPVPAGTWSGLRLKPWYDKSRRLEAWV